jgi:hypothetical protein
MELSKQVCSRQQADRLRELGVTAPSIFYYTIGDKIRVKTTDESPVNNNAVPILTEDYIEFTCCHAYTVAELVAMFGRGTAASERLYDAVLDRMNEGMSFTIAYSAEFLATCLIGAIERNLITPEQCNENLNH